MEFALTESYSFWVAVLEASMSQPLDTIVEGRAIPELARTMVDLAGQGLKQLSEHDAERSLSTLYERIEDKCSPSERLVREHPNGDIHKLIQALKV